HLHEQPLSGDPRPFRFPKPSRRRARAWRLNLSTLSTDPRPMRFSGRRLSIEQLTMKQLSIKQRMTLTFALCAAVALAVSFAVAIVMTRASATETAYREATELVRHHADVLDAEQETYQAVTRALASTMEAYTTA